MVTIFGDKFTNMSFMYITDSLDSLGGRMNIF